MRAFFRKLGNSLIPACEVSEKIVRRADPDELVEVELKSKNTRSLQWHRRYFGMCKFIAENVERFHNSTDEVHFYLKRETRTWDSVVTLEDGTQAYFVKSIAFHEMNVIEWEAYWKKAIDVVYEKILPQVVMDEAALEIEKFAGMAA